MKTAISVPDDVFRRVEEESARLGISRSGFFATAACRYLDDLGNESLVHQINEAIAAEGADEHDEGDVASLSLQELASRSADEDWS